MDCTTYVAKTKALISFAATKKLICVFVFAYAKCWFSRDAAQLIIIIKPSAGLAPGLQFVLNFKVYLNLRFSLKNDKSVLQSIF